MFKLVFTPLKISQVMKFAQKYENKKFKSSRSNENQ